ncbi:MAG: ACP S-malonyltransferase [Beutenbergiaceae bacterium]
MISILCPGQGSQTPGMLAPWLALPGSADLLARFCEAAQLDLTALGTTASAEEIKDTAVAQPLIVATSLIAFNALIQRLEPRTAGGTGYAPSWASASAGHSVGEYAAAVVAGVLADVDAISLVATRGRAMAHAAAQTPTGMSAVIGGDPDQVRTALAALDLVPANVNGGGQVVAAGALTALDELKAHPPVKARVIPLPVAGAFHTTYMAAAVADVNEVAQGLDTHDPELMFVTNADGSQVRDGSQVLAGMVAQIARPVRWDLCQSTLVDRGVDASIELAPAGVLTGLARRCMPGTDLVAIKSPDDLDTAANLIHRTAEESR